MELKPIAYFRSGFSEKFGIPRQSGYVATEGTVEFLPAFSDPDYLRGIEEFSHLWLLWEFSENGPSEKATVRPPRLGGNERRGVFATRSPFRPNPIGMSCVKLKSVNRSEKTLSLTVIGADLLDGTPIYDIKPYLPFSDSVPDAKAGFAEAGKEHVLTVTDPDRLLDGLPDRAVLFDLIAQDPRPAYQSDPSRVYTFTYHRRAVSFRVEENTAVLMATEEL